VVQAMSGIVYATGNPGEPMRVGVPIADVMGAMACVQGVLLALEARHSTGLGQWVDISMLHALMLANTSRLAELLSSGQEPIGQGTAHNLVAPYQVFDTADGQVIAGSWTEDTWPRLCRAIGLPELADDPRFTDNVLRVRNRDELAAIVGGVLRQESTAHWEDRFHQERALFGPVLPIGQAITHEQTVGRPAVVTLPHPDLGTVTVPDPPSAILLHGTPGAVSLPAPRLGEHTHEILAEFGLGDSDIDDLLATRTVSGMSPRREPAVANSPA
jgi:crotonobetainyl-CoA:carnitine CoA-transferase CaiB-like acyl-CoA transferase